MLSGMFLSGCNNVQEITYWIQFQPRKEKRQLSWKQS